MLIWVADVENGRHHQGEAGENLKEKKALELLYPLFTIYCTHYFVSMDIMGL